MIVYADLLSFTNSIVTYFLLLGVCAVFKFRPKTYRLILGALFGGLCSLTIFLPEMNFFFEVLLRIVICSLQVLITFSFKNKIRFLKLAACLLTITYIFGGAILSVLEIFETNNIFYYNGVAYFNISPMMLILSTCAIYLFIKLLTLFKKGTTNECEIFNCTIEFNGVNVNFLGVNDTGNSLLDPYFARPVAIVEKEILKPILDLNPKTYLIPLSSVLGEGTIFAFKPTSFKLMQQGKFQVIDEITIGICEQKLHNQYGGILSPEIIKQKEQILCFSSKSN